MSEQQLVNSVKHYLNMRGHFVWRNNSGVTRATYTNKRGVKSTRMWRAGVTGGSDILGVTKDGRFLAVECKVGKNMPTANQVEFLQEVAARGGIAIVVWDIKNLEDYDL